MLSLQGPSFSVDGWHVSWQQWDVRLSFNGREGLVLHSVGYRDTDQGGRRRPVMHRGSIVEMCVPYAGECGQSAQGPCHNVHAGS
jgi:primary-amine oxidase